jgi:pimeloyl-ACP methyl ester carboxylesterase
VVQGRAWSFDTSAVVAPVWVLHGEADTVVPLAHGTTADVIPGASLLTWPQHGHISILAEIPQLAADLAATLR